MVFSRFCMLFQRDAMKKKKKIFDFCDHISSNRICTRSSLGALFCFIIYYICSLCIEQLYIYLYIYIYIYIYSLILQAFAILVRRAILV